jgi:rhamnose transport system permease protein
MRSHQKQIGVLLANVALMATLGLRTHGFFTAENFTDLFLSIMPVMIVSIGMTLIILTGHIDISVGSVFAVCSIVMGTCAAAGVPLLVSGLIACLLGAFLGGLNGVFSSYLRIPSIVVTLATMVILRDALRWKTQGAWVSNLPERFQWFGVSPAIYNLMCAALVVMLIAAASYGLRYLRAGRIIFATGSNEQAAAMTGINTNLVIFSVFTITGLLTGFASALNAVRFNQIPVNLGLGLEMKVIAAVAVGGAEITGGSVSIAGTVLGVILLGCISSALTFLQINAYWEKAIQGAIILIAVASGAIQHYRRQNAKSALS